MNSASLVADQWSAAEGEAPFPFHDAIAARAHEKWEARAKAPGSYVQDWLEAEAEFMEAYFRARKRNERRLIAEHTVTRILAGSADIISATPQIVQVICECLGWDLGAIWTLDGQARALRCVGVWRAPSVEVPEFEQAMRQSTFAEGVGLPGRVWANWKHVWMPNITWDAANFPRAPIAAREGLHAACAFPVHNGVEFLGVMEFFSRETKEPDAKLLDMMVSIGDQLCQFLERRRAEKLLLDRQREVEVARLIQQALLPKTTLVLPGFVIGGAVQSCQETGGDFYDVFPMPDGNLAIAIGDASGHGLGAALVISATRACIRALALTNADPASILAMTNRRLTQDVDGHFATLFLARFDPGNRSLAYSNAGHLPGYLLDHQGKVRSVLPSTGIPLGIDPTAEFPNATVVALLPGDCLFLSTDGITEAFSPQATLFGIERALQVVRGHRHENPETIAQELFRAVADFTGDQAQLDDFTAVIGKVEATA